MSAADTARSLFDVVRIATGRGLLRHSSPRAARRLLLQLLAQRRRDLYVAIDAHAITRPLDPAVSDAAGTWSWSELADTVDRVAGGLARVGLRAGDRVAILLSNRREHLATMAAARKLGAVPMPLSPALAGPQVVERLKQARAAMAFCEPHHADAAVDGVNRTRHHVVVVGGTAPARTVSWAAFLHRAPKRSRRLELRWVEGPDMLLHTSGTTTGRSSSTGITMSKAGIDTAFHYIEGFDFDPDAVLFTPCPLYHAAPMLLTGLTLTVGGHVVLRSKWDEDTVPTLVRYGATHAFLVPTLLDRLSRSPERELIRLRRSPLRALISGGAALRASLKGTLLDQLGPVLYDFYGATELGVVSIAGPGDLAVHPDSVGRLLPGVDLKLVADDGHEVAPGEPGELFVRSSAATEKADSPLDGWTSAGDVARYEDGLLFIVDRKRDVVISGGVNLFPVDIELALEKHPDVREAAALGVPDEQWGEALHAFVVLEPGAMFDPVALKAHCKEHLARYAVPKGFHTIEALPRSPTGKVLRRELREQLLV